LLVVEQEELELVLVHELVHELAHELELDDDVLSLELELLLEDVDDVLLLLPLELGTGEQLISRTGLAILSAYDEVMR
jgi:hypothetical protein